MVFGRQRRRIVQRAGGDVDLFGEARAGEGELAAARAAESASRATVNQATIGAPVVPRQMLQWQMVRSKGVPAAS
jgi:hypothetical protein